MKVKTVFKWVLGLTVFFFLIVSTRGVIMHQFQNLLGFLEAEYVSEPSIMLLFGTCLAVFAGRAQKKSKNIEEE
ncbi:MAG: PEP-CTERM sorting domain-containing protein [Desulfopila sp.]|jgi:hypothetical protein|nr:PEP-CTERM sorting domain-containing protein [Desulfopila sp.]